MAFLESKNRFQVQNPKANTKFTEDKFF
jgi:hypothetical protein